jgi:simple sugar transport system permease protein
MTVNEVSAKDTQKAEQKRLLRRYLSRNGTQLGIIGVFAVVWLFFILFAPNTFLSPQIYAAFMATVPFFGIIALPLTMVIIAGEMDLSFPAIMAISMVAFIFVFELFGSVFVALIGALIMGVIAGLLNGALVVWIGIPSLVVTIGTQFFWRGASLVIRNGTGFSLVAARDSFTYQLLVGKTFGYIPNQFIWMVIVGIVSWIILNRTRLGAHIYLIGDNEKSAELMGVNTRFTRVMVFVIVGIASAFAGVLASLHVSYFWPSLGDGYLLQTLASVFLGGTSVFGGVGTILGTFLGSYIIGAIEAAIVAIGLTGFWTQLIYGLIIILSVSMHAILRKRMK